MGTKSATRETLIASACRLFLEKGLAAVSMEEISAAAGCTRRNLYRYYGTKDDLAVDVVIVLLEDWNNVQTRVFESCAGKASQRLRGFLGGLVSALDDRRDVLRLLGEFDFVYRDTAAYHPDSDRTARFLGVSHLTETYLERLLALGLADGSLDLPTRPEVLVPTLTTVLWGLAQRVALRETLIREEFGVSGMDLVLTEVDLILRALTPPLPSQGGPHGSV